jgi:hypothetical protein
MHKQYNTVAEVQEAIDTLEHKQKTTSHKSASEESKLIKEIE